MSGKRYFPEEIISKLREAEVYLAEGVKVRVHCFYPTAFGGYTHINTNDEDNAASEHSKLCAWVLKQK